MASTSAFDPLPASSSSKIAPTPPGNAALEAVVRNTLRYTVSAREYAALHRYILARSPITRRLAPTPASVDRALRSGDVDGRGGDYNPRAVRHALRLFAASWLGLKSWQLAARRFRDKDAPAKKSDGPKASALRLSLSLSAILLLYRLLYRFFYRLRLHLLNPKAAPFRLRNPRTASSLTSPYTPAIGASIAGIALAISPARQLRVSIAIYMAFRALEFGWNACLADDALLGRIRHQRKGEQGHWIGSWMLLPPAFGQLFHALVFDRDCFPEAYGNIILSKSSAYLQQPPSDWPGLLQWPTSRRIVDSLGEMAHLKWPSYISPAMSPGKEVLPSSLTAIAPVSSGAHPLISSLACATLHPSDPSCLRTYVTFWLDTFPPMTRLILIFCSVLALLPRPSSLYHRPIATVRRIVMRSLRTASFLTGALSTAWASICLFQNWLPPRLLSTQRFFLGGFLAGLWAWVERRHGRPLFLHIARISVNSLWKVGVKRRWWKTVRGGDVCVFVLALLVTGVAYERDARAVRETHWRKGISWVRGQGWRDWAMDADEDETDDQARAADKLELKTD